MHVSKLNVRQLINFFYRINQNKRADASQLLFYYTTNPDYIYPGNEDKFIEETPHFPYSILQVPAKERYSILKLASSVFQKFTFYKGIAPYYGGVADWGLSLSFKKVIEALINVPEERRKDLILAISRLNLNVNLLP